MSLQRGTELIGTHLLLLPQSEETNTRDLHDLESDTRNITLSLAASAEARDKDFVIFVDEVEATIILSKRSSVR